jgi:hypothetical protein
MRADCHFLRRTGNEHEAYEKVDPATAPKSICKGKT